MNENPDDIHALEQALLWLNEGIRIGLQLLHEDLENHDSYDLTKKRILILSEPKRMGDGY